jgi:hypothetical protein
MANNVEVNSQARASYDRLSSNAMQLSPARIDAIVAYRNPRVVSRYARDLGATRAEAETCFATLKQFLAACAVRDGGRVPSKTIDAMWHTFLLFTADYREFCENRLGKFLHHNPSEEHESKHGTTPIRETAESMFGMVDERLWPRTAASGDCDCSPTCDCCA